VIVPIVRDELGSAPDDVSVTVAQLQRIADISGSSHPPERSVGRLRIMFVVGSSWPWRAIESDRASPGKRMMCFREPEQIQRIVLERLDWRRADEQFVAEHMATPGNLSARGSPADRPDRAKPHRQFSSYHLMERVVEAW
jgi:hypothetical protein